MGLPTLSEIQYFMVKQVKDDPEFKTLYNGQHFPLYTYQNNVTDSH